MIVVCDRIVDSVARISPENWYTPHIVLNHIGFSAIHAAKLTVNANVLTARIHHDVRISAGV